MVSEAISINVVFYCIEIQSFTLCFEQIFLPHVIG